MPGEVSPTGGDIALDAVTGRAAGPGARTMYLMLIQESYTVTDDSTFANLVTNEITSTGTNGYSRQSVTWGAPANNAGVRRSQNTNIITFGPFTADLPNVGKCALVSVTTGSSGDFVAFWSLDTPRDPANGDSISFAVGALSLSID
jgi:hypothetical protein